MIFDENMDVPRNPVVLRALNQARKVCNALIRKHGAPYAVHIEMARDLSRPMDERTKIKKLQDEFRDRNKRDRELFAEEFDMDARSREFERYQLYREQQGKCAYSLEPLDLARVLHEQGYAEVDHALPYARCFDDSKNNKVLALTRENRNKGNRTPYEFMDGANNSERWRLFVASVEGNKLYRQAKRSRLLRKEFGVKEAEEFKERNLNDTRYICRFFKNYVEQYLKLADSSESKRCVVVNGQLTAFLRARWGLLKVRSESDRHHALDAAVVAACSHSMVKRLADYSRRKLLERAREVLVNIETGEIVNHFPEPWTYFRHELNTRLHTDNVERLREDLQNLGTYPQEAVKVANPLFVSRAPQRRSGGQLHEKTFRSPKLIDSEQSSVRVSLQKLKLSSLSRIVGADDPRNVSLISALRQRLETYGDDGEKAFAEPLRKPSASGKNAPIVKNVKLISTQKSGVLLSNAIADLGGMLSIDIYRHGHKYFVDPVYGVRRERRINPETIPDDAIYQFSLTKNDYVRISIGEEVKEGYFVMYESDGRITLRAHDQPQPDKKYFRRGIANAKSIEKFNVDVLGNLYLAPKETYRGLA